MAVVSYVTPGCIAKLSAVESGRAQQIRRQKVEAVFLDSLAMIVNRTLTIRCLMFVVDADLTSQTRGEHDDFILQYFNYAAGDSHVL